MARIEENAAGVIDGANDVFETVTAPYVAGSLNVLLNGFADQDIVELGGKQFRLVGVVAEAGDTIAVNYRPT
jgi:hypothetical protein